MLDVTVEADPTVPDALKDGVAWEEVTDIPAGLADGTDDGIIDETDPIFTASPAGGIGAPQISNWDAAFSWGNHAAVGYLNAYTETDPTFATSPAYGIGSTQIGNWNAAHGWGDHSTAGYLASEVDPKVGSLTDNFVPKWSGASLVSGTIFDNGNIGIGSPPEPGKQLVIGVGGGQDEGMLIKHLGSAQGLIALTDATGTINFSPRLRMLSSNGGHSTLRVEGVDDDLGDQAALVIEAAKSSGEPFTNRNLLQIRNDNSSKVTITADGNVGIGTIAPEKELDVIGNVQVRGPHEAEWVPKISLFNDYGEVSSGTTILGRIEFGASDPNIPDDRQTNAAYIEAFSNDKWAIDGNGLWSWYETQAGLKFYTSMSTDPTPRMTIDPLGKVGIGTTAPSEKLEVNGTVKAAEGHFDGNLEVDGNVGIGTATPTEKLDVNGTVKADAFVGNNDNYYYGAPIGTVLMFAGSNPPSDWIICDGSLKEPIDFPKLFNVIGYAWGQDGSRFRIPDFRGVFPRGVDERSYGQRKDWYNMDRVSLYAGGNSGKHVGSYQEDSLQNHLHEYDRVTASPSGHKYDDVDAGDDENLYRDGWDTSGVMNYYSNPVRTNSKETRPKNVYVYFIIKAG